MPYPLHPATRLDTLTDQLLRFGVAIHGVAAGEARRLLHGLLPFASAVADATDNADRDGLHALKSFGELFTPPRSGKTAGTSSPLARPLWHSEE
jgi:hypothetical protein